VEVEVEGSGREGLVEPDADLDCGNSGTTMRLLAGVLASVPHRAVLTGDGSLLRRPMERVAEPLRAMGGEVSTTEGRPPLRIRGGSLRGIAWAPEVPSAQVKSAVLLAGLAAEGETEVRETAATRDHTERVLAALGAPIHVEGTTVRLSSFRHGGFEGSVPGDVSSAAFLVVAAALTGGELEIHDVGLNPTRTRFLDVLDRMGVAIERSPAMPSLGEPVGMISVAPAVHLRGTTVGPDELPLIIDEIPALALLAVHAEGESRFEGAGELRVKESDRLSALAEGIRDLGGDAAVEGDALVVGGGGLRGGAAEGRGDHRLAMAFLVGALAAKGPSTVEGVEWTEVSFPGFTDTLRSLGVQVEVQG
jgi:3-phosphoshikimate 1-carboxyvinyltransferase